jgi:hypothetical protein
LFRTSNFELRNFPFSFPKRCANSGHESRNGARALPGSGRSQGTRSPLTDDSRLRRAADRERRHPQNQDPRAGFSVLNETEVAQRSGELPAAALPSSRRPPQRAQPSRP